MTSRTRRSEEFSFAAIVETRFPHAVPDLYVIRPGGWEKTVGGKHEAARKNQGANPPI